MPPSRFSVRHQDRGTRVAITVVGDIDLTTAPLVRGALARCLPARTVDVDLTGVGFCDVSALNVFVAAAEAIGRTGAVLRLHRPPDSLVRVVRITGCALHLSSPRPAGEGRGEALPSPLAG
ncbi:hypothetical protein GCM10010238_27440 [Streptomyces griseoviridis]|uniref:STAS domain-containing protein n=1 Tax=Streptomyces griseoviridis TaxID=45398 RepID=A0A918LEJ7_STRGD|nr:hypothetical protein GCM10010238_27440 [Streptomyces niveoruber]